MKTKRIDQLDLDRPTWGVDGGWIEWVRADGELLGLWCPHCGALVHPLLTGHHEHLCWGRRIPKHVRKTRTQA